MCIGRAIILILSYPGDGFQVEQRLYNLQMYPQSTEKVRINIQRI